MSEAHRQPSGAPEPPVPSEWEDLAGTVAPVEPDRAAAASVIGIVGDSGSGKNTVADAVAALLGRERVTDLRLDDYHRYTREERAAKGLTALNPIVHDLPLVQSHLGRLRQGESVTVRSYLHEDGTFGAERTVVPRDLVLVRGLLGFPTPALQQLYDLAVFLRPEPDLLFRWKLRRDVLFRGYTEAEVLKSIANHLLDAKEFVLPQAELAHVLIDYRIPDWEAPDDLVMTTVRVRGAARGLLAEDAALGGLPVTCCAEGEEIVVEVPPDLSLEEVDRWGAQRFASTYGSAATGEYYDTDGSRRRRASLAAVELMLADLGERLVSATPPAG